MNKKIKNLFLAGALVLGFAGVAVSCTDYDKDINDLQQKITAQEGKISTLETNVNSLQSAINAGAVITSVTPLSGELGGWKFTLSDGKSYDVTNGAAGAPGKDGKFYTPNAETGCWDLHEFVDGKEVVTDTKQKYLPENGATITYDAEKNVLVVKQGEETHEISLTATSEAGLVFLPQSYIDGVEGLEAKSLFYTPLQIATNAEKKSTLNSKNEKWVNVQVPAVDDKGKEIKGKKVDKVVQVPVPAQAQYHVNVSDFEFDDTFTYEFIYKDVDYIKTRTEASKDFSMTATFNNYADGVLTVDVAVTGREAYGEDITRFALQATKDGKTVTSDYATLLTSEMRDARIADPFAAAKVKTGKDKYDEHYRRGTVGISQVDAEDQYRPDVAVWTEGYPSIDAVHATCDTAVAYDSSIDLATITATHFKRVQPAVDTLNPPVVAEVCTEMKPEDMEAAGLSFVYEVVLNYKIGTPVTPQDEFVTLDGSVFTPRTFETSGTAAIGRTPIIRVKLMHGEDVVQVAYVKVFIAERVEENPTYELVPVRQDGSKIYPQGENVFRFRCEGDALRTTVKDMNEQIYDIEGVSKDKFHATYDSLKAVPAMKIKNADGKEVDFILGTVKDIVVSPAEGTHVIEWTVTPADLWEFSGQEVQVIARYFNKTTPTVYVDVLLTATVADAMKGVALSSEEGDYIREYWTPGFEATLYNVRVPDVKDTAVKDSALCQFNNDINASFVTYPAKHERAGQIMIEEAIDSVVYYFCTKHIEGDEKEGIAPISKIGDLNVVFEVGEQGDTLYATILNAKGDKVVAAKDSVAIITNKEITNEAGNTVWNSFHWVKGKTVADTLLNTGAMYTYIGATAYLCVDDKENMKEVDVTFDGEDHFRANVIRPVTVATTSKKGFIDGVDFGEDGSYIKIEDLIDPVDWRQRLFSQYPSYWNYYGPFVVVVDIANAECDLNGKRQPVPTNIVMTQVNELETKVVDSKGKVTYKKITNKAGFLTYKNNMTGVTSDFNIFVKAKVQYGFGYIDSEWITVPVKKTIGQ
jgi:hypothetical protein